MSFAELTPFLKELSYSDKLLLLDFLVAELLPESVSITTNVRDLLPSHGLHDSFEAAAVLAKALAEEKVTAHG